MDVALGRFGLKRACLTDVSTDAAPLRGFRQKRCNATDTIKLENRGRNMGLGTCPV